MENVRQKKRPAEKKKKKVNDTKKRDRFIHFNVPNFFISLQVQNAKKYQFSPQIIIFILIFHTIFHIYKKIGIIKHIIPQLFL